MAAKKDPERFTVRFNSSDPAHRKAIALLEQQGNRKAQYLTNAILHYEGMTPDTPATNAGITRAEVERIVRELLAAEPAPQSPPAAPKQAARPHKPKPTPQPKQPTQDSPAYSMIADTLAAFRSQ